MKLIGFLVIMVLMLTPARASLVIPQEIQAGFVRSKIGESGGLYIYGVDEAVFSTYILGNWKLLMANVKSLPFHPREAELQSEISLSSLAILGAACEKLPPLEYLDFLDQMLTLFEQSENTRTLIESNVFGVDEKHNFLSVNWEHPRVLAILSKYRELIPSENEALLVCVDAMASGALADNYMYDRSDDAPRPETLPGIKLKRPWDSIIKKYERVTGRKLGDPNDPTFNPRAEKRGERPDSSTTRLADNLSGSGVTKKQWTLYGLLLLAVAYAARGIWKRKA